MRGEVVFVMESNVAGGGFLFSRFPVFPFSRIKRVCDACGEDYGGDYPVHQ